MNIYPAIDLYRGKVVRLLKGDYNQMTVYNDNPLEVAISFQNSGASYLHIVDLEGAKEGTVSNLDVIRDIAENTLLFIQVGGGIRSMEVAEKYLSMGVDRVILGTAAITDKSFLKEALKVYGEKIAVGVDIKEGKVAINGWTKLSCCSLEDFCEEMQTLGVKTLICTDISKDGAMEGTNRDLYKSLSERLSLNIIASGGVSSLEDIKVLSHMNLYGAILGKALYTGAVNLQEAVSLCAK